MLVGASKLIVAIDVAKLKVMAGFGSEDGSVVRVVRFESPMQTREFVELVVATGQALARDVDLDDAFWSHDPENGPVPPG